MAQTPQVGPEAADDAMRDALALVRAWLAGDQGAAVTVSANLSWPQVTAVILAQWVAGLSTAAGRSPDDTAAAIGAWQQDHGLS